MQHHTNCLLPSDELEGFRVNHQKQEHADCLLPFGELVGFGAYQNSGASPCSQLAAFNLEGGVFGYSHLETRSRTAHGVEEKEEAKKLILAEYAKKLDYMSGILLVDAPLFIVDSFVKEWMDLAICPKKFISLEEIALPVL